MIDNLTFANFKPYSYYAQKSKASPVQKKAPIEKYKPIIGSAIGVGVGFLLTRKVNLKNHQILNDLIHLLAMMGGANIGSVLVCSIGKSKDLIKKKIHEGVFQIMNAAIPLLLVGGANALCNKYAKENKVLRIVSSAAAMIGGAAAATVITNATKDKNEPERKYTIKDTVANVDDIVATALIGFPQVKNLHLDTTLMPLIYTYCGKRAGEKE